MTGGFVESVAFDAMKAERDALRAEVERLRKRGAELWERGSLAMRQRDVAEAKVAAVEHELRGMTYRDSWGVEVINADRVRAALATEATP